MEHFAASINLLRNNRISRKSEHDREYSWNLASPVVE